MKKKLLTILATTAMAVVTTVSLVACGGTAKYEVKGIPNQIGALMEVQAGQADAAIIDSTMAGYLLSQEGNKLFRQA